MCREESCVSTALKSVAPFMLFILETDPMCLGGTSFCYSHVGCKDTEILCLILHSHVLSLLYLAS